LTFVWLAERTRPISADFCQLLTRQRSQKLTLRV
jgi:hypothetical protein